MTVADLSIGVIGAYTKLIKIKLPVSSWDMNRRKLCLCYFTQKDIINLKWCFERWKEWFCMDYIVYWVSLFTCPSVVSADAVNNSCGLGFSGYDENGVSQWNLLHNVDIWTLEVFHQLDDWAWRKVKHNNNFTAYCSC